MFLKKPSAKKHYDANNQIPVLHCSICTGEQVAGFKDVSTGKFEDVMLIRSDADLQRFKKEYGVDEIKKEY